MLSPFSWKLCFHSFPALPSGSQFTAECSVCVTQVLTIGKILLQLTYLRIKYECLLVLCSVSCFSLNDMLESFLLCSAEWAIVHNFILIMCEYSFPKTAYLKNSWIIYQKLRWNVRYLAKFCQNWWSSWNIKYSSTSVERTTIERPKLHSNI